MEKLVRSCQKKLGKSLYCCTYRKQIKRTLLLTDQCMDMYQEWPVLTFRKSFTLLKTAENCDIFITDTFGGIIRFLYRKKYHARQTFNFYFHVIFNYYIGDTQVTVTLYHWQNVNYSFMWYIVKSTRCAFAFKHCVKNYIINNL